MKKSRWRPGRSLGLALALVLRLGLGLGFAAALPAWAEGPMLNDDAGTLGPGKFKIEGVWNKLDTVRNRTVLLGYGLVQTLELNVAATRLSDSSIPATANGEFASLKWVPYAQGEVTAGGRLDYERARSGGITSTATTLAGLVTWRSQAGSVLHFNAGRAKANNGGGASNVYGAGAELPLAPQVQLTFDYSRDSATAIKARQWGLRWEVMPGLKVYGARARATGLPSDETLGFAWEF